MTSQFTTRIYHNITYLRCVRHDDRKRSKQRQQWRSELRILDRDEHQRWDRSRITGVDSGRILRFPFGPVVKNL